MNGEEQPTKKKKKPFIPNYEQQLHRQVLVITKLYNDTTLEDDVIYYKNAIVALETLLAPYLDEEYKNDKTEITNAIAKKREKLMKKYNNEDDVTKTSYHRPEWARKPSHYLPEYRLQFEALLRLLNRKELLRKIKDE